MNLRRFPPPWSVDAPDPKLGQDCYIVRDAYVKFSGTGKPIASGSGDYKDTDLPRHGRTWIRAYLHRFQRRRAAIYKCLA
jgi:hypothetical protein